MKGKSKTSASRQGLRVPWALLLGLAFAAVLVFIFWKSIVSAILETTGFGAILLAGWLAAFIWIFRGRRFRQIFRNFNRWLGAIFFTAFIWCLLSLFCPENYMAGVSLKETTLGGSLGKSINGTSYIWARLLALGLGGIVLFAPRSSSRLAGWLFPSLCKLFLMPAENLWRLLKFLVKKTFRALDKGLAALWPKKPTEEGRTAAQEEVTAPEAESESPSSAAVSERSTSTEFVQHLPSVQLLDKAPKAAFAQASEDERARLLEEALSSYGVEAKVAQVNPGPSVTQFGVEPGWERKYRRVMEREPNGRIKRDKDGNPIHQFEELSKTRVKVDRFLSLTSDLALTLAVPSVRIEAPVPGKSLVGIEVPNVSDAIVSLRSIIEGEIFQKARAKSKLVVALGQAAGGEPVICDLAKMPHLLIAGATGSGKTVCLNSIITSLLMTTTPGEVRLVLIDPKRVEMVTFTGIPHLLTPVVVEVNKAIETLRRVTAEMDRRFSRFAAAGVRNIDTYNRQASDPLPYIIVFIDELADLMMAAPDVVEPLICRLAQLSRSTGIHLMVATQRPSVDVITGLIKANFPARISFAVVSLVDSRTILDAPGAEKLLGRGDMLYLPPDAHKPRRLRGCFVSDEEVDKVTNFWKKWAEQQFPAEGDHITQEFASLSVEKEEPFLEGARELARSHSRLSISLLQRRLHVGYPRAARLMEKLEEEGLVGSRGEEGE